jgi:hypothetical protein
MPKDDQGITLAKAMTMKAALLFDILTKLF